MNFCSGCILPKNYKGMGFLKIGDEFYCPYCIDYKTHPIDNTIIFSEWKNYLDTLKITNKEKKYHGLFAYSGGRDSTLGLYLTKKEFDARGMKLLAFTIDHGFKGKQVWKNIKNMISFLDVEWEKIDLTYEAREKFINDILNKKFPCVTTCKIVKEDGYKRVAKKYGIDSIITGGDGIVNNSICIKKYGIPTYGSISAYRLSEKEVSLLIKRYKLPWKNVGYGGFDTDCLVPGIVFGLLTEWKGILDLNEVLNNEELSILLEYFSCRTRLGIISREEAFKSIFNPKLPSKAAISEFEKIIGRKIIN